MKFSKRIFNSTFGIFLVIAVLYAAGNFIWWRINTPIAPIHFGALYFYDIFRDGWFFYNAPLITWIMRFMFYMFGKEYYDLIVIFVNYIFFLIPLYFIYKIGSELKDKETGNIAMILFALVPAVYGMSRQYGGHQNYQIMAAMTFNIYCLIKSEYFKNRKWTIFYGISVGFGLMIKDIFLIYFSVPFIYVVVAGLKDKFDKIKMINIFIAVIIASLIAGWHYFRYDIIIRKVMYDAFRDSAPLFAFDTLRVTTIGLWEELLSPPIFIIFIIGLIFFILKYRDTYKNILLLWFFVPWFGITIMPHFKVIEYELGFIPAIILICAEFISNIKTKYIKKIIIFLLVIVCFLQYINYSFLKIGLFNLNFKYKNHIIQYFNNDVDREEYFKIIKFAEYLKNKYHNNKFYIADISTLDLNVLLTQIFLKDMYAEKGRFLNDEVFLFDIIIFIGRIYSAEDIFKLDRYDKTNDPVDKKQFANKFEDGSYYKIIGNILQKVKQEYSVIDVFYLNEGKSENLKVTLFGKKDKFIKNKNVLYKKMQ